MTLKPLQPPRPTLRPPPLAHPSSSGQSSTSTTTTATTQPPINKHHHSSHHHNPHLPNSSTSSNPNSTFSGVGQVKTEPRSTTSSSASPPPGSPSGASMMPALSPGTASSGGELGDDYGDDDDDDVGPSLPAGLNGIGSTTTRNWGEGHVNQPIQSQPVSLLQEQSARGFMQGQGHVDPSRLGMSGVGPTSTVRSGSGSGAGLSGNRGINVADLQPGGGRFPAGSSMNGGGHGHSQFTGTGLGRVEHNDASLGVDADLEAILPPSAPNLGSGSDSAGTGGRFEPWNQGQSRLHQPVQHQGDHPYQHSHQQNHHQQRGGGPQQQQTSNQGGRMQNHNGFDASQIGGLGMPDAQEEMNGFPGAMGLVYPPSHQQQLPATAPTPGPPGLSSEKARTLELLLVRFWTNQMDLAERGLPPQPLSSTSSGGGTGSNVPPTTQKEEFKNFALPLARIKKVMKSDPEVKMISAEVPVLLGKCCEIFIAELTSRAWLVAQSNKRRTLQKSDVAAAIGYSDMFDFLIDIVPREEAIPSATAGSKGGETTTASAKRKKDDEVDGGGGKRQRGEDEEDE